mmetsp:Transcript_29519/g.68407  ORF Transcript_29519/g.68407 Transcript_29519/m.68407 type:complete len:200 (-) Transcript_29519:472-1071(-)
MRSSDSSLSVARSSATLRASLVACRAIDTSASSDSCSSRVESARILAAASCSRRSSTSCSSSPIWDKSVSVLMAASTSGAESVLLSASTLLPFPSFGLTGAFNFLSSSLYCNVRSTRLWRRTAFSLFDDAFSAAAAASSCRSRSRSTGTLSVSLKALKLGAEDPSLASQPMRSISRYADCFESSDSKPALRLRSCRNCP